MDMCYKLNGGHEFNVGPKLCLIVFLNDGKVLLIICDFIAFLTLAFFCF